MSVIVPDEAALQGWPVGGQGGGGDGREEEERRGDTGTPRHGARHGRLVPFCAGLCCCGHYDWRAGFSRRGALAPLCPLGNAKLATRGYVDQPVWAVSSQDPHGGFMPLVFRGHLPVLRRQLPDCATEW